MIIGYFLYDSSLSRGYILPYEYSDLGTFCQSLFYEYLINRWVLSIAYLKTNFWSSSRRVWF